MPNTLFRIDDYRFDGDITLPFSSGGSAKTSRRLDPRLSYYRIRLVNRDFYNSN